MGFAQMAWTLAKQRAGVPLLPLCFTPDRVHALRSPGGSSWHYYQILNLADILGPGSCQCGICWTANKLVEL